MSFTSTTIPLMLVWVVCRRPRRERKPEVEVVKQQLEAHNVRQGCRSRCSRCGGCQTNIMLGVVVRC